MLRFLAGAVLRSHTTAAVQYPRGDLVTKDAASRAEYLESALGLEPGSVTFTHNPDVADAGWGEMAITSPRLLTSAPLPWPGPSAPGADMRVPFRLGLLQDGREFTYPRLPIGHRKVTGVTDSGKTMSLLWNMLAEGITRQGYAAFAIDVVKGDQFLGALRPVLHRCATEPEGAMDMLAGLHRARLARCDFLAKIHATEWFPGCRLSFLEVWLEEASGILRLLGRTQKDRSDGRFMLEDWVEDVTAARSAGMSVTASYQKPVKEQAFSTVARSQMGTVCFGVRTPTMPSSGCPSCSASAAAARSCGAPATRGWRSGTPRRSGEGQDAGHAALLLGPGQRAHRRLRQRVAGQPAEAGRRDRRGAGEPPGPPGVLGVPGQAVSCPVAGAWPGGGSGLEPVSVRAARTAGRIRPGGGGQAAPRAAGRLAAGREAVHRPAADGRPRAWGGLPGPRDCTDQDCTGRTRGWLYAQVKRSRRKPGCWLCRSAIRASGQPGPV